MEGIIWAFKICNCILCIHLGFIITDMYKPSALKLLAAVAFALFTLLAFTEAYSLVFMLDICLMAKLGLETEEEPK